jgi:hypothetical protein
LRKQKEVLKMAKKKNAKKPQIEGNLPDEVLMLELLLRDGLQHAETTIPTDAKVWYAEHFVRAGYKYIEVTNFGHPALLAQSRDAEEILERVHKLKIVQEEKPHLKCYGMTRKAFERAADMAQKGYPPDSLAFTISTEDLHGRRNSGRTRQEYLQEIPDMIKIAESNGFEIDMAIACVYGSDWIMASADSRRVIPPVSQTPEGPTNTWRPWSIATANMMMRLNFARSISTSAAGSLWPTPLRPSWPAGALSRPHWAWAAVSRLLWWMVSPVKAVAPSTQTPGKWAIAPPKTPW